MAEQEILLLRHQALIWLRSDLTALTWLYAESAQSTPLLIKTLNHWKTDDDLVSVRDKDPQEMLPEVERRDWQKLWFDVNALLRLMNNP
ncbi:MAG TPA: hypothetical protein VGZ25_05215 [Gemmataceae bacterium]|nr:hypothetical protein [Gemmataceae bacterium]